SLTLVALLQACAGGPPVSTAPKPAPSAATSATAGTSNSAPLNLKSLSAAPDDWHRLSPETDGVFGVGSERALKELLNGKTPTRKVVVAVIDGGVDTAHTSLVANLWHNTKEINNGKDDDGDGLIDDALGWNFAGGSNGKSVDAETFEVTRLYAACRDMAAGKGTPKPDAARCTKLKDDYEKQRSEVVGQLSSVTNFVNTANAVTAVLKAAMKTPTLTRQNVEALKPGANEQLAQARDVWLQIEATGLMGKGAEDAKKEFEAQLKMGLDLTYDSRVIVGDNFADMSEKLYGNRDVTGPDAKHGTHVAGIIGAARNGGKVQGIAPSVQIMAVRAVPNGDERDKDIANAIRFAVDHGANIINMSFGKSYSPGKSAVDAAAKYAESKGVLMVHAAGNDGENIDVDPSFPSPYLEDKTRMPNWLEVGASSWKGLSDLAAEFSNYGKSRVDVFAPGVDILSTIPGGGTEKLSGTSMAAPVVSGVAALLMSYFPSLTATDIKDILVQSARRVNSNVGKPGDTGKISFGALSQSGGVVDAYAAVKLAQARAVMK
ncbi:MAG: S8 family serine peptidase, partial [Gemmatimonadaceae bacterium]